MISPTLLIDLFARYRRRLGWWLLMMICLCVIYVSFYPSVGASMTGMVDTLPSEMIDAFGYQEIGTARGWLASTVFGVLGSTLVLGFGISTGSSLCAGEEEAGTLELELTSPLSRSQLIAARIFALAIWIVALVAATVATSFVISQLADMDVPLGAIASAGARLVILSMLFACVAFAIGATTGRQGIATGGASALAAASFMADALAPSVGWDWLARVSPHGWYGTGEALLVGFDAPSQIPAVVIAAGCIAVAFGGFARRDVV